MDVRGYVEANAGEFIDDLKQWLTIPSISADPARHGDVGHSAAWLAGHLRGAGFPVAQVLDTGGLPAVFAEWPAADPAAPTVLVYGHHDVQPVEPHQGQGTAVLARGKGSKLATCGLDRRAGRKLAVKLRPQKAFSGAGPMFHAGRHFLPDIAAFLETDAFKFFKSGIQREDLVGRQISAIRNAEREAVRVIIAIGHSAGCLL